MTDRILITNDDGIEAPGIRWLARAAQRAGYDVVVAAPLIEASVPLNRLSAPVAGGVMLPDPDESSLELADLDAAVRSTSTIVSGSPTLRARQPS